MSIFKLKPWWSNEKLQDEKLSEGIQNGNCLKVDRFSIHSDSDCVILGEDSLLKIYKPNSEQDASHLLLETHLNGSILHIETGKFITGSENRQILVLHPQSYSVYDLLRKEGHTNAGEINLLTLTIKHTFTRKAHCLTCGPFGKTKTRDLICVQGVDGSLSFFDQDIFLFISVFDNVIIPGPVSYIASSDSFVVCRSTWVLEIYSYEQLRDLSELHTKPNKKNTLQWLYNAGEEISSVQVIQTSNSFSSIVALGERFLSCFQDNGLLKFTKKFNYAPVCFYAYLVGWYYEPGARLLIMVASDDSKLYIYEGTTVLWSCALLDTPISLSRCFMKTLSGGVVSLSRRGIVNISYLGTEPDLNPGATPIKNETYDPEEVQAELKDVEDALQRIMHNKDGPGEEAVEDIIKIKAEAGKPIQNLFQQFTEDSSEGLHLLMCPLIVILTCKEPKLVQAVQLTFVCAAPFATSDSTICLDAINGTEIIETHVFLTSEADISDTHVKILFTITNAKGTISVTSRTVVLPESLYYLPVSCAETEIEDKIEIITNKDCVDLVELFADFSNEDLTRQGSTPGKISFVRRGNKKEVTIRATEQNYVIESKELSDLIPLLECAVYKLTEYFARMDIKNVVLSLRVDKDFKTHLTHRFLKSIEVHAKERIKTKQFEDYLNILQRQFIIIQKRLLVQYGSSPPGDCDPLEFLMRDTFRRITETANNIIQCRGHVCRAGCTMAALGQLMCYLFRMTLADHQKVNLFEEMISLNSLYDDYQDWEESVTLGLSYVLKNFFKKSERDNEKLAAVTEQGVLSLINLKRFLKQLKIVIEGMFTVLDDDKGEQEETNQSETKKILRIEEFVEVI